MENFTHILVYCNVDEDGEIVEAILGPSIIPDKQYDYFFYSSDKGVYNDITQYKVDLKSKQLVKK